MKNYNNGYLTENTQYIYETLSLENDELYCYSGNENSFFIQRNPEIQTEITIRNIINNGSSIIKGIIDNYSPSVEYKGFVNNDLEENENIHFEIENINGEYWFTSSFKQNIDGEYKFFLKGKDKDVEIISNKEEVLFEYIKFNDNLIIKFNKEAHSIEAYYYDEVSLMYDVILKSYKKEQDIYQIEEKIENIIEPSYSFTNLENKKYKIEVWKTNKYGEKVKLSRNTEIDLSPGYQVKSKIDISFDLRNYGNGGNYYAYLNLKDLPKDENDELLYKYFIFDEGNQDYTKYNQAPIRLNFSNLRYYFYNGELAKARVDVFDKSNNLIDSYSLEEQLKLDIFFPDTPSVVYYENCKEPSKGRFKLTQMASFNSTNREIFIDEDKLNDSYETKPYVNYNLYTEYKYDLLNTNQIAFIAFNNKLYSKKEYIVSHSFNGESTKCNSNIYSRFSYTRKYNDNGDIIGWDVVSNYGNSSSYIIPGKVEYKVNGSTVKTLTRDQLKNNVSFSIPMSYIDGQGKLEVLLYNVYGKEPLAKHYIEYFNEN